MFIEPVLEGEYVRRRPGCPVSAAAQVRRRDLPREFWEVRRRARNRRRTLRQKEARRVKRR